MAGSKVLQFFLLILLMIFSMHALKVLLTEGKGRLGRIGFHHETEIYVRIDENRMRRYNGCVINSTFKAGSATIKVIVYIKSYRFMKDSTLRQKFLDQRQAISDTLWNHNYEMLYLAVHGYIKGDERLIAEFLLRTIEPNPYLEHFQIDTIGEKTFNLIYPLPLYNLTKYKEDNDVFGGKLLEELRSMEEGYV